MKQIKTDLAQQTITTGRIQHEQAPKAAPLFRVDSIKEYDLIMMRHEVADMFKWCPYIYRIASRVHTFTFPSEEAKRTGADGISYKNSLSIGINADIMGGKWGDVWKMAYLHELAHLLAPGYGHTPIFHTLLDELINFYNQETGTKLKNNYFGLKN